MRVLNSHFVLIDLHTSWRSAAQTPCSAFACMKECGCGPYFSAAFRRTRRRRNAISSASTPMPSIRSPEIRRPRDRSAPESGLSSVSSSAASTSRSEQLPELELFLELLPLRIRNGLSRHQEIEKLIEVVMDLGRQPLARFPSGDWVISEQPVKLDDLSHAISKVGEFSDDNRSGINSSLHRISAIRNRKMQIIGLTCRVGRAVSGSAEIIGDLVGGGGSILVVGPPGVGKTTLIREIARMLADEHKKRVVIVDTSNEIGGDGDIPHSGIGRARRMQVPNVNMQHNVMIEAVENHMPETIIIDEIGTELEALAASTIAQRGVQLVGTAHGITIDNIIKNPSLQILVGGIESVTLGDEEAKKRKVQKTILERKGPPTFTCAIEMISRTECRVHHRLDASVDAILAGKTPLFEVRHMDVEANHYLKSTPMHPIEEAEPDNSEERSQTQCDKEDEGYSQNSFKKLSGNGNFGKRRSPAYVYIYKINLHMLLGGIGVPLPGRVFLYLKKRENSNLEFPQHVMPRAQQCYDTVDRRCYGVQILEADLLQVASVMGLEDEIDVSDDIGRADAILASSSEVKQNPWICGVAKFHKLPLYVIKSNTMAQMVKAVRMILERDSFSSTSMQSLKSSLNIEIEDDAPKRKPSLEEIDALEEVRLAIEYIVIPGGEPVELLPRRSEIIARQLELVESYQLAAENSGTELNPRLQILPQKLCKKSLIKQSKSSPSMMQKEPSFKSLAAGGGETSVARLPLLPE